MTLCTERFTCCVFGITTAATTVVVVAVVVVVLTLTHRYCNAVRGHRTGSNNLYSSSFVQYARIIMRLIVDETNARGAQVIYVTRTHVWLFGEESACIPQAVGHMAVLIQW